MSGLKEGRTTIGVAGADVLDFFMKISLPDCFAIMCLSSDHFVTKCSVLATLRTEFGALFFFFFFFRPYVGVGGTCNLTTLILDFMTGEAEAGNLSLLKAASSSSLSSMIISGFQPSSKMRRGVASIAVKHSSSLTLKLAATSVEYRIRSLHCACVVVQCTCGWG